MRGGEALRRERRRKQVLDSAQEIFSRKGFHQASISDIIQKAGIARGTFYLYFKNKRHVFNCLLELVLQELDQRIESIELGAGKPPPLDQLRANLTRVITFGLEKPQLIQILLHHAVGWDKELDRALHRFYERVADRIERALKLGIERSLVRPCPTRLIAYGVLGGMKEIMGQLTSRRMSALDIKAVVDGLLEFGLRGVLVEASEG